MASRPRRPYHLCNACPDQVQPVPAWVRQARLPWSEDYVMSQDGGSAAEHAPSQLAEPKPPGLRELSPRAILCGLFVAAIMGASYPYVVLKLGFGPNVSVVAAILGYLVLGLLLTRVVALLGLP